MKTVRFTIAVLTAAVPILMAQTRTTTTTTTRTTWNGTLVDAACQSRFTERRETTNQTDPGRTTRTETTVTRTVDCPATASTTSFGLMTSDGRYIRFDEPSNSRVVEIMRGNRNWDPHTHVNVIGMANGDMAVVESLNADSAAGMATAGPGNQEDMVFDVRYHDDRGKLIVTDRGVSFENVSNANKSRSWTFGQIKELKRDGKEIKIDPYHGDDMEFKLDGKAMSDTVYRLIADRIVAARRQ